MKESKRIAVLLFFGAQKTSHIVSVENYNLKEMFWVKTEFRMPYYLLLSEAFALEHWTSEESLSKIGL